MTRGAQIPNAPPDGADTACGGELLQTPLIAAAESLAPLPKAEALKPPPAVEPLSPPSAAAPLAAPSAAELLAAPSAAEPLDWKRLFTAFTLTPLLAGFYPAIFLAEPSLMPIGLVLSYASTVLFGVPLVAYFDRRGVREWYMYIAGGTACSLPTVLLYALAPLPEHVQPFGAMTVLGLLLWGGSSGIVFWMIGIAGDSAVSLRSLFDPVSSKK